MAASLDGTLSSDLSKARWKTIWRFPPQSEANPLISADELDLCENGVSQPSVICRPSMSLAAGWALKFRWLG